jgi:murein DD-endopeptidase MepM/ murein hydrolase activator NlpD
MNKEKVLSFIKGKQFYYVLLLGFVAIFAISSLIFSNGNKDRDNVNPDLVDLNTPLDEDGDVALLDPVTDELDELEEVSTIPNTESIITEDIIEGPDDLVDQDLVQEEDELPVLNDTTEPIEEKTILTFNEENGLAWPVQGDIILRFSNQTPIYYETLDQYKVHPAMAIKAMIGNEVKVAARGVIEDISTSDELGTTVVVNHGDGYETVYGQLKELKVNVGDTLEQGDVIGLIEEPTKYYGKEGSHLHFQVLKDSQSINPESLLN